MDISYKWLKRYIDFDLTPRDLAATFTSLGLECDSVSEIETIRGGLRGLVTGKVLTCTEHPNSDHLHITTVDLGQGEPVQIVCGAPNVAAGQNVIVATVGTTLYDGDNEFKIKKSKIRGVESFGMICAEDEIGVGTDHAGIIVLPEDVTPGIAAAEYYKVDSDYRLEVELTPNRVDAASHYGCARDLKARMACTNHEQGNDLIPQVALPDVSAFHVDSADGAVGVTVEDEQGCPRYTGVTIRDIEVGPSPEWLRNLLLAAGQRPINNIVDITNFVLLGIGQPLHCFDLDHIGGEKVVVRTCPAGTEFTTLDGREHKLHESDLMICDAAKPMCIAGVFGGLDSGVTDKTRNVFIESAYFNPTRVRRTARRHGLSTDASFRYERGADPDICLYAAKLAAVMIQQLAGGRICGEPVDIYPHPIERAEFDFSLNYCGRLIGKTLPRDLIICILRALDIEVVEKSDDLLHLTIPTYRVDVTRPCDVVEEILRVYGYNNVEFSEEMHANLSQRTATDRSYAMQQTISEQLTALGFMEIMNNSLSAASYYEGSELYRPNNAVRLLNPLSGDLSVMRQTLLYGGLESIAHNINRKATDLKFYEFGNVYSYNPATEATAEKPLAPFAQHLELGIWMTGNLMPASWNVAARQADIYDLRGVVDTIMTRMGIAPAELKAEQKSNEIFSAYIEVTDRNGRVLASIGNLRSSLLKKFDIERPVVYAALNWEPLFAMSDRKTLTYSALSKTLPVERDLALLVDKSMKFDTIEHTIRGAERKLLRDVLLFDVYEGKNLPAGKKSYAVKMILHDENNTLTDKQIDSAMQRIVKALEGLGATLR